MTADNQELSLETMSELTQNSEFNDEDTIDKTNFILSEVLNLDDEDAILSELAALKAAILVDNLMVFLSENCGQYMDLNDEIGN